MRDPSDVLLKFVARLPTTIRYVILARCCMAFGRLHVTQRQDLLATFRAILTTPVGEQRAYVCAMMTSVVELALHHNGADSQASLVRLLSESPAGQAFGSFDPEAPLVQKHWEAAREDFQALRRSELGTPSLHSAIEATKVQVFQVRN